MRSLFLLAIFLAACAPAAKPPPVGCILDPPATIGGPIALTDQAGAAVTEARFAGAPALLYFGFTYCPDVCPFALQAARETLALAGPGAAAVRPVLISLDPERDSPAQMAQYVSSPAFPAGLVGLTGDAGQTAAAAKAFRVAWRKNLEPASAAAYLIDHSSFFYVMGRNWRTLALYPSNMPPDEAAICLRAALAKDAPAGAAKPN